MTRPELPPGWTIPNPHDRFGWVLLRNGFFHKSGPDRDDLVMCAWIMWRADHPEWAEYLTHVAPGGIWRVWNNRPEVTNDSP